MNRGQCRDYLQKILESGVKFGLDNVRTVLAALGEPQRPTLQSSSAAQTAKAPSALC